MKESIS